MDSLIRVGTVKAKHSRQITESRLGVGLEKLDRKLYDPRPCYGPIGELGVKWVRIQSGWSRTELYYGIYDFTWLDEIVDNLLAQGVEPWMDLCYGNGLYTVQAERRWGAVGWAPIHTREEREAWIRYVTAVVTHFRGRVRFFEVWNEPDGEWCWRPAPSAEEYGDFALRTARAIHTAVPEAKVVVGSFCRDFTFFCRFMSRELAADTDYVSYHRYSFRTEEGTENYVENIRAVLDSFGGQHIGIIQGETGTQSRFSTRGALNGVQWTERTQANFLLRKTLADLGTEVLFTSWFSTVDIFENITTDGGELTEDWYGFFGLLGESFDEAHRPLGVYRPKQAYRSMQVLCSLFGGSVTRARLPMQFMYPGDADFEVASRSSGVLTRGFRRENGSRLFAWWKPMDVLTEEVNENVSMRFFTQLKDVHLIDPYDGSVYVPAPEQITVENGVVTLRHLPLRDVPLLLTFGDWADWDA